MDILIDVSMHHNEGDTPDATEDTTTTQQEAVVPFPVINTVDGHPEKKQLTDGQVAMSVDFNPNGNPDVAALKLQFATTYDLIAATANKAADNVGDPKRSSSIRRWEAIAKTDLEKAQMAAVKAITR